MAREAVGLHRRKGSTIYRLRMDIPRYLQSIYGKAQVRESLSTSD